jgi:GAF domain-containing protein
VPLVIEDSQVSGALNIYARQPNAFDQDSRSVATRFAPYVAVAASNLSLYQRALKRAGSLEAAWRRGRSSSRPRASSWSANR